MIHDTKFIFYLSDITVFNAYLLSQLTRNPAIELVDFRLQTTWDIVHRYSGQRMATRGRTSSTIGTFLQNPRQFTSLIPNHRHASSIQEKGCGMKQVCETWSKKGRLTHYEISDGNVGLCRIYCFTEFDASENVSGWLDMYVSIWNISDKTFLSQQIKLQATGLISKIS